MHKNGIENGKITSSSMVDRWHIVAAMAKYLPIGGCARTICIFSDYIKYIANENP